ncbi:MAG: rhodanese-like domain-containing protein [Pseudomonadota bacterium]
MVLTLLITGVFFRLQPCHGSGIERIEPQQLERDKAAWVILDARPEERWKTSRIPGALSFSWEAHTRTDDRQVPYRVQDPETLAAALGTLGIAVNTPVAVYGDADSSWGGEGWVCWVLTWMSHQGTIALLDGGIQAWTGAGYPLEKGGELSAGRTVVYQPRPDPAMMVSARDLHDHLGDRQLVDTRSFMEWIRGHLPGAVHITWESFFFGGNRRPLDSTSVRNLLADHGISPERPVVYYCTGGIRSGYAWMVHELAGLPRAVNFEGGTAEWDAIFP